MNCSILISGLVLPFLFVSFLSYAADYPNILLIVSEDNGRIRVLWGSLCKDTCA